MSKPPPFCSIRHKATPVIHVQPRRSKLIQNFSSFYFKKRKFSESKPRDSIFVWGTGMQGELGMASQKCLETPEKIPIDMAQITDIASGEGYVATFSAGFGDQQMLHWGQLKGSQRISQPTKLSLPLPPETLVKQIAIGQLHSIALLTDGTLLSWGTGKEGQLGRETFVNKFVEPGKVEGLTNVKISKIFAGLLQSLALSDQGQVYSWGNSQFDQLAHGDFSLVPTPKLVEAFKDIKIIDIATNLHSTLFLTSEYDVLGFGRIFLPRIRGKMGLLIKPPKKEQPVKIIGGLNHYLMLTASGRVFTMGDNSEGQLGVSENNDRAYFSNWQFVEKLDKKVVKNIFCGANHSFVVTEDKQVFGWGVGSDYQLGTGVRQICYFPEKIEALCGLDVVKIVGGWGHSLALVK